MPSPNSTNICIFQLRAHENANISFFSFPLTSVCVRCVIGCPAACSVIAHAPPPQSFPVCDGQTAHDQDKRPLGTDYKIIKSNRRATLSGAHRHHPPVQPGSAGIVRIRDTRHASKPSPTVWLPSAGPSSCASRRGGDAASGFARFIRPAAVGVRWK